MSILSLNLPATTKTIQSYLHILKIIGICNRGNPMKVYQGRLGNWQFNPRALFIVNREELLRDNPIQQEKIKA